MAATNAIVREFSPEFLRLPRPGSQCPWTGLSRSKLNELILPMELNNFRPPVKSIVLRNKGQQRGVRLIVYRSLMDFLHGQVDACSTRDEGKGRNRALRAPGRASDARLAPGAESDGGLHE